MAFRNGWHIATAPVTLVAVVWASAVWATPASAALTASLQALTMPESPYSHQARTVTGKTVLSAADDTEWCSPPILLIPAIGSGWNVSLKASDFVYSGPNRGSGIPAQNLAITSVGPPTAQSGMAVDATDGPRVPGDSPTGSLDQARVVLSTNPGYGCGSYTQGIDLALSLPARTRAGTYTSTITTTITAGP